MQRTVDRKPLRLEVQGETFALRDFGLPDMFNGRSTFLWQGAATDGAVRVEGGRCRGRAPTGC